jgi:hypothetical protein
VIDPMLGPTLAAADVRLEAPRPEHLPSFVRWFADAEVTRAGRSPA